MSSNLDVVNQFISLLPTCGQTCIQKLPEWTVPLTTDALTGVCNNFVKDANTFYTCVQSTCSNVTDINSCIQVIDLVPTGCTILNITVTGFTPIVKVLPTASAVVTTKSGGDAAHIRAFGVLAVAVSLSALLF